MTTLLKLTLEDHAADGPAPYLDAAALAAAGRQRVRRRRLVGGVGVLAMVAALGAAAPYLIAVGDGSDRSQVATDTGSFAEPAVSWAVGSEVRYGDRTVEVGAPIAAYVMSDAGVVAAGDDGVVRLADGDGVTEIGRTEQQNGTVLVADGPYAAWYDTAAEAFVAYDTVAREEVLREPEPAPRDAGEFEVPMARALDGNGLWVSRERVIERLDLDDATRTMEIPDLGRGYLGLLDAEDGWVAQAAGDGRVRVFHPVRQAGGTGVAPGESHADLSPSATYVATDPDDSEQVWEVATGEDVTPDLGSYDFHAVVQWLSDDTYQALATTIVDGPDGEEEGPIDFLVCSVAAGSCELVAEDAVTGAQGLNIPVGEDTRD